MTRSMPPMRETETVMQVRMSSRSALRQHAAEWDRSSVLDLLEPPPWKKQALCIGQGKSTFVPAGRSPDYSAAQRICANCTVRVECFDYALKYEDRFAVAGMTTPRQRAKALDDPMTMDVLVRQVKTGTVPLRPKGVHKDKTTTRIYGGFNSDYAERAVELRRQGVPLYLIASEIGVRPDTIRDWMYRRKRAGLAV